MDLVLPQWRLGTQLGQRLRPRNKDIPQYHPHGDPLNPSERQYPRISFER